jgi:predicted  nucleic acid-binding Zn-ribbon protein
MSFQLCPKCQGQGIVSKPPWIPSDVNSWSSSSLSFVCNVCNGSKILESNDEIDKERDNALQELASLKKLYNDLLEIHAKQVILNQNQSETIGNLFNQIDEIKKESREWQLLSDHFKAANQVEILESELLKANERIAELEDENKTLSQFDER